MKKAQTATEYLIILSVVIIIALIVVGVMGGIPGMGGSSRLKASSAYWAASRIAINSYAVTPTQATLYLRNNYMDTITITSIYLDEIDLGIAPRTLATGESASFTSLAVSCSDDSFSYDVLISYTDSVSGTTYTFTGDGQTLDGNCANS